MTFDTVIHGGQTWIDGALANVDVAITDGRIAAIGTNLGASVQRIDAVGKLVLPGGIDVHTHFHTDVGGAATADTYESGTRAAAFGGLTTVLNYAFQGAGERLADVIQRERAKADKKSYIDYGLHVVITDASVPGLADDLASLPELGCPSIKVFTALDFRLADQELLRVLATVAGKGVLVNVHAEDGALVDYLSDALIATGHTGIDQLGPSRPPRAEALATEKMVTYAGATGCPLYIVHLSSLEALNAVRRGRSAGIEVYVETRPAYLYLDEAVYGLPGQEGNRYACWPPLRSVADQNVLWDALGNGEVQCYATDHTTWTLAEKMNPKLMFNQVPGGISNVQTSLGMLFSEGVSRGRMSLARFVEVTAQTPAQLFGLWPRKGVIRPGADADIVIMDPQLRYRVVSERMESASDFDPYDGYESSGWPVLTMSRGQIVVADQQLLGSAEHGRFYHRDPFKSLPLAAI